MKTTIILSITSLLLASAATYGANITLQGSEASTSLSITDPASWNVTSIGLEDTATITTSSGFETTAYINSGETFQTLVLHL